MYFMNDDLSDLIKNFSNSDIDINKVKDMLNNLSHSDKSSAKINNSDSCNNTNENIDINTILKIQEIISKINSSKNDNRTNLLLALKPFLRKSKQEKISQYIKLMNIAPLLEMFNNFNAGDKDE